MRRSRRGDGCGRRGGEADGRTIGERLFGQQRVEFECYRQEATKEETGVSAGVRGWGRERAFRFSPSTSLDVIERPRPGFSPSSSHCFISFSPIHLFSFLSLLLSFSRLSTLLIYDPPRPATPSMDQHQQQSQPMHDDSSQNFVASQYAMYPSSEDDTAGYLVYPQMQQPGYPPVVHNPGAPPRGFLHFA